MKSSMIKDQHSEQLKHSGFIVVHLDITLLFYIQSPQMYFEKISIQIIYSYNLSAFYL